MVGAGFNRSIIDPALRYLEAPLTTDLLQVVLNAPGAQSRVQWYRSDLFLDDLLGLIDRYWGLSLDDLKSQPFDVEECMTLFESLEEDPSPAVDAALVKRASLTLKALLQSYVSEISPGGTASPCAHQFGKEILSSEADVLTTNYDDLVEQALEGESGLADHPFGDRGLWFKNSENDDLAVPEELLDVSLKGWKRSLACGFQFDEVTMPVMGKVPRFVERARYYGASGNKLYNSRRVLKLHGSVDWLKCTGIPSGDGIASGEKCEQPTGILQRPIQAWPGRSITHRGWLMEPLIIPPVLRKSFDSHPFPDVWNCALESLSSCRTLVIVGYSIPPTDFRIRRLFREAFDVNHKPEELVIVNPDPSVAERVWAALNYRGTTSLCPDLPTYYGVPESGFAPRN